MGCLHRRDTCRHQAAGGGSTVRAVEWDLCELQEAQLGATEGLRELVFPHTGGEWGIGRASLGRVYVSSLCLVVLFILGGNSQGKSKNEGGMGKLRLRKSTALNTLGEGIGFVV